MIDIAKMIKFNEILCLDATSILFIYLVESVDIIGGAPAPARCCSVDLKRNASLSRVDICLGRHNDTDTLHITTCSVARNNSSVPFRWQNNRHPRLHLGHWPCCCCTLYNHFHMTIRRPAPPPHYTPGGSPPPLQSSPAPGN